MMKKLQHLLFKIWFPRRAGTKPLDESGQSLIILTFAFLGLIAMLGLALDLGLVYVERVRMKRTVDAAVLAAVSELPVEEEAARRAIGFLSENGYDVLASNIYIAGCVQDIHGEYSEATHGSPGGSANDDMINLPVWNDVQISAPLITDTLPISPGLFYHYVRYDPNSDGIYDPNEAPSFYIDFRSFQTRVENANQENENCAITEQVSVDDISIFGGANKIKIYGQIPVRMSFMQFFGFPSVMVSDEAVAENSSSLDVVVVLDNTGSMMFDTICFGCWGRCGDTGTTHGNNAPFIDTSECTSDDRYLPFPDNGRGFPYDFDGPLMEVLRCGVDLNCSTADQPLPQNISGEDYIVLEAEFYSYNSAYDRWPPIWDPRSRTGGQGYWAMQRNRDANAYSIDGYGENYVGTSDDDQLSGYVRHHPFIETSDNGLKNFGKNYSLTDAQSNPFTPRLEYDFTIPAGGWSGNTHIHLRTQWMNNPGNSPTTPYNRFFWTIDTGAPQEKLGGNKGGQHHGTDDWDWISINAGPVGAGNHTLKIWAGSPGYGIDRIIITDQPGHDNMNNTVRRAAATPGSAQRVATDPCNPIFGRIVSPPCTYYTALVEPTNNLNDALFHGLQPIRGAQQAIKNFVGRLDPQLDQAGVVVFNNDATQYAQLECLRASQNRANVSGTQVNGYPFPNSPQEYDELTCFDEDEAVAGTVPVSYTVVFKNLEDAFPPGGGTDIADGLRRGLHMLGVETDDDGNQTNNCGWTLAGGGAAEDRWRPDGSVQPANIDDHCGRGQAATPIIVLLTDGAPTNNNPGDNDECRGWGETAGWVPPYEGFPSNLTGHNETTQNRYECIMYYAEIAGQNGIIVYAIGLGVGADEDLLQAVADETNGRAYFVFSASQLDQVFDQILSNIYVRLVQ